MSANVREARRTRVHDHGAAGEIATPANTDLELPRIRLSRCRSSRLCSIGINERPGGIRIAGRSRIGCCIFPCSFCVSQLSPPNRTKPNPDWTRCALCDVRSAASCENPRMARTSRERQRLKNTGVQTRDGLVCAAGGFCVSCGQQFTLMAFGGRKLFFFRHRRRALVTQSSDIA